jgi:3,4-dihydroxy 2-butanone 4-phosphate synthase/GTP cyclohydrolase II
MADYGSGILLYLRQEGRGIGLQKKLEAYLLQDQGYDTVEANTLLGLPPDSRDYRIGAEMLLSQGVKQVRLLTNNPLKIDGLEQHGITVVERVPLITEAVSENHFYLQTKRTKMGHLLFEDKFFDNGFH